MALYDTRPMADRRSALRAPGMFGQFVGMFSAWNDARVTRNALSRLSDHELNDLGLSRADIDAVARRGR
jgi:uncharacterized protein YjiS (DUF1127 family)